MSGRGKVKKSVKVLRTSTGVRYIYGGGSGSISHSDLLVAFQDVEEENIKLQVENENLKKELADLQTRREVILDNFAKTRKSLLASNKLVEALKGSYDRLGSRAAVLSELYQSSHDVHKTAVEAIYPASTSLVDISEREIKMADIVWAGVVKEVMGDKMPESAPFSALEEDPQLYFG